MPGGSYGVLSCTICPACVQITGEIVPEKVLGPAFELISLLYASVLRLLLDGIYEFTRIRNISSFSVARFVPSGPPGVLFQRARALRQAGRWSP